MGKYDTWKCRWEEMRENDNGRLYVDMYYHFNLCVGLVMIRVREWSKGHVVGGGGTLGFEKRIDYQIIEGSQEQCIRTAITLFDSYDIDKCVKEVREQEQS